MEYSKQIKVVSQNGFPVIGAHVVNLNGTTATITNLDGMARIKASPEHEIKVSHVSGSTKRYKFSKLPEIVELEANELDEVVINAKPKKTGVGIFAVLFVMAYLIYQKSNS